MVSTCGKEGIISLLRFVDNATALQAERKSLLALPAATVHGFHHLIYSILTLHLLLYSILLCRILLLKILNVHLSTLSQSLVFVLTRGLDQVRITASFLQV